MYLRAFVKKRLLRRLVSPSRASVLSIAQYFQAPATQAKSKKAYVHDFNFITRLFVSSKNNLHKTRRIEGTNVYTPCDLGTSQLERGWRRNWGAFNFFWMEYGGP